MDFERGCVELQKMMNAKNTNLPTGTSKEKSHQFRLCVVAHQGKDECAGDRAFVLRQGGGLATTPHPWRATIARSAPPLLDNVRGSTLPRRGGVGPTLLAPETFQPIGRTSPRPSGDAKQRLLGLGLAVRG